MFRRIPVALRLASAHKRALKNFADELSRQVTEGRPFNCVVTNDRELRRLNYDFLGHDYSTDVLSFPSGDSSDVVSPRASACFELLGDVAISSERASAQAAEFGHSLIDELRILMLHGVLHLSGFDHESDSGRMARAERKWRVHFALPQTLIERSGAPAGGVRR
ncbi:MAG TPA: rRNA maturation RNase YbeY [Bryobacteraceae bacterium]|nr:rRNA maturation RNase YbeY [Bryobacteraceae bacterium]